MTIYFLNPPLSMRSVIADTAWMNFNTSCPEYDWMEPIINWDLYQTVDQVIDEIVQANNRAQRTLGPKIPKDQLASKYLKMQYDKIKEKDWFLPIKKHLDDIVDGILYDKDISLIEHVSIEDIVKEHEQDI